MSGLNSIATVLRRHLLVAAALMVLAGWSGQASAVVIYDESIDGDAPSTGLLNITSGANVGVLNIGSNEILGGVDDSSFDDYIFEVAAGTQLTSIFLSTIQTGMAVRLIDASLSVLSTNNINATTINQEFFFPGIFPLSAGVYRMDMFTLHNFSGLSTYQWTLTVEAVSIPEPGTLALFGVGLAGLGWAGRRRVR